MPLIVIKKREKKESYRKKLVSIKNKGIDTGKYCGKVKIPGDPVKIQKKLRNEWQ
jgi:hypothetical protein